MRSFQVWSRNSTSTRVPISSSRFTRTLVNLMVRTFQEEIPVHIKALLFWLEILASQVKSRFRGPPNHGDKARKRKTPREKKEEEIELRSVRNAPTFATLQARTEVLRTLQGVPFSAELQRYACRLFVLSHPLSSDHEQLQLLQLRSVAGSRALEARMERCQEGMGRLFGYQVTRFGVYPR